MTQDIRAFRAALGEFVTGVTIITTSDAQGVPAGLTANSFNSVSLDPPMVLFSLALNSTSLDIFRQAKFWAVHVLSAEQEALSNQFAKKDGEKFAGVHTVPGPGNIPLLPDFAARFVCRAAFEYEGGDHAIFLGEVTQFEQTGRPPLVYHKGRYAAVFPSGTHAESEAQISIDHLAERGLISYADETPHLTPEGREIATGLCSLAETDTRFSRHELKALKHLLTRLAS